MSNLSTGLMLLIVGMVTVFVILLIVICFGKLLIATVNKLPDKDNTSSQNNAQAPTPVPTVSAPAASAPVSAATETANLIYDLITPVGGRFSLSPDREGQKPSLPFRFKKGDALCKIATADGESTIFASEDGTIITVLVENGSTVETNDVLMNISK